MAGSPWVVAASSSTDLRYCNLWGYSGYASIKRHFLVTRFIEILRTGLRGRFFRSVILTTPLTVARTLV